MEPLLEVTGLEVSLEGVTDRVRLLSDTSISVSPGETVGIVGESGSGKSLLVRTILNLLEPPLRVDAGTILFEGTDLLTLDEATLRQIRGRHIALTTPDPRKHLNPLLTVGRQIVNSIQAHQSVSAKDAMERAVDLLASVGIPDPGIRVAAYPHELSGGMCQRIIIAMALAHESKLLLIDEPTAGLDVTISRQILDLIQDLVHRRKVAVLLVSRDLGVVAHYCERVAVMHAGQIVEQGDVRAFFEQPLHPYSQTLLHAAAAARDRSDSARRGTAEVTFPVSQGCAYAPRCPVAAAVCWQEQPSLERCADDNRLVRCWRRDEIRSGAIVP